MSTIAIFIKLAIEIVIVPLSPSTNTHTRFTFVVTLVDSEFFKYVNTVARAYN